MINKISLLMSVASFSTGFAIGYFIRRKHNTIQVIKAQKIDEELNIFFKAKQVLGPNNRLI